MMADGITREQASLELHRAILNGDGEALASAVAFHIACYKVRLEEPALDLIAEAARQVRQRSSEK